MADKNSFILMTKYGSIFAEMSDRQAGVLIKAIFHYIATGETMDSLNDVEVKTAFKFVKLDLDYNQAKYDALCQSRSKYGKMGAQAKASISQHKLTEAKEPSISQHNDIDNDVDIDIDNKEKEIDKEKEFLKPLPIKRFIKPTFEEVKAYCLERKNNINSQSFIDFYSAKGWKIGSSPMKDWKAAIRTWEQRQRGEKNDGAIDYNRQNANTDKYANFGRKIG